MNPQLEQRLSEIEERETRKERRPLTKMDYAERLESDSQILYEQREDIPFLLSELRKAHEALECARKKLLRIQTASLFPDESSYLTTIEMRRTAYETLAQIAKTLGER